MWKSKRQTCRGQLIEEEVTGVEEGCIDIWCMRLRIDRIVTMFDEVSNGNAETSNNTPITATQIYANLIPHAEYNSRENIAVIDASVGGSMAKFRQYIDESHHDLVNLLTHQMTTILNPILADNESKYDRLVKQVERIARIVDYDEGQPITQYLVVDQENVGYNEENVFNNSERKENIPYLVRRYQNADEFFNRLHTQCGYHYHVTRIVEDVLNGMGLNVGLMHRLYLFSTFPSAVQMT
ncbi:hypothetical protein Ahy_A07g032906 [Arachis hypogaea]|uniref:Uncharacterized protein n=1 Tax=Arachis hypogaea TaxID=3818 RepID=A0A445C7U7_ARAHY|nr:hypothetical protein Ahy_A07g032906 [Arachis hypogaea]